MTPFLYVVNVVLIALIIVLVLGGITAGTYCLIGYLIGRFRIGGLDERFVRQRYRRGGAILMGVGVLGLLGAIPRFFGVGGPVAGTWGTALAGAIMIALGRILMLRFRDRSA